jgi:hypothetical protein
MDANELLNKIRGLIVVLDAEPDNRHPLEELLDTFPELDEHLSRGGFLPTDWQRAKPPYPGV